MSQEINISSRAPRRSARIQRRIVLPATRRKRTRTVAFVPRPMTFARRKNDELKFFDLSLAQATTASWAVHQQNICLPTAGTGNQNRLGSKITVRSINCRAFLSINAAESQTTPNPMIMTRVFVGLNVGGGTVTNTFVFDTGATSQVMAYRNIDHTEDHLMIKDWTMIAKPQDMNEGAANLFANGTTISKLVKWNKTYPKGLNMKFVTGADTFARNAIFVMSASTATGAVLNVEFRCRYTDG